MFTSLETARAEMRAQTEALDLLRMSAEGMLCHETLYMEWVRGLPTPIAEECHRLADQAERRI